MAFESLFQFTEEQPQEVQAMKAIHDPDTLYLWEAMKEPDADKFLEAMQQEVDDHTNRKHWELCKRSDLSENASVLPSVWSMKRKRRIATREVYKWKARLTVDRSKQKYGIHYDETYSPVVQWSSTRFFLIQALLNNWYTHQIDFVLAYAQACV